LLHIKKSTAAFMQPMLELKTRPRFCPIRTKFVYSFSFNISGLVGYRCKFHIEVCCQTRAAFANIIFDTFMETAFCKIVPKYGARCKSCSLKYALKFQCKCWRNKVASFASFTLCWRLCTFQKLVGEMGRKQL
jgi:hypothetical protein